MPLMTKQQYDATFTAARHRWAQEAARSGCTYSVPLMTTEIAAASLVFGDRLVWGGNRILTVQSLAVIDSVFMLARCTDGPDMVPLDLHLREAVRVLVPRPLPQPPPQPQTRETA